MDAFIFCAKPSAVPVTFAMSDHDHNMLIMKVGPRNQLTTKRGHDHAEN